MEQHLPAVTAAEHELYGDALILLEGCISEFLSCMDMIRRYRVSRGLRDPVASVQSRIKSAASMRQKLERLELPLTADSVLHRVRDAAGVRLICPFVEDIFVTAALIRAIPGLAVLQEKDYIHRPKPNGYRSYHMILSMPLRFIRQEPGEAVCLEVQLRTLAMDCWASIEHQLKYKREVPHQGLIVEELKRCADEIASTDLSLETLRHLIDEMDGREEAAL